MHTPTRYQLAKLLTNYSCRKLSGDEFASAVFDVRYKQDQALDLVTDFVDEVFEPEFGKPVRASRASSEPTR